MGNNEITFNPSRAFYWWIMLITFHEWKTYFCILLFTVSTKSNYTLVSSRVLKTEGARCKIGGAEHSPLSWTKLDQASFSNSKKWLRTIFLFLCHKHVEFQMWLWCNPLANYLWVLGFVPSVCFLLVPTAEYLIHVVYKLFASCLPIPSGRWTCISF